MSDGLRHPQRLIWVGLALTGALLALALLLATLQARYRAEKALPVWGQVAEFTLTNQNQQPFGLANLRGRVWVADIIFTRCAGPCLTMTRQMRELQAALRPDSSTMLVSLTTDPEFDIPAVLRTYADRFGADSRRWQFLTGPKSAIASAARDSLKLTAIEKTAEQRQSPEDLFIHSTIFVLVDKQGRLRGIYETSGEGVDPKATQAELLRGIQRLERES